MKKRKLLIVTSLMALMLLMSTVGVYAYFTDYESAKGGAVVHLNGESTIQEQADDNGKVVSLKNTGDCDLIVRVGIYGDFYTDKGDSDWVKGSDGFWYYKKILEPGKSTSDLTVTIDKKEAGEAGHDFDIVVVQESSRVMYDGSDENRVVKPDGWLYPDISVGMEEVDE